MSSSASSYKRITYYSWWGEDCIHPNCAEQFLYYHVASFLVFLIESLSRFDPATFKTNPTNIWFDREKSPNVKKKQGKYLQMVSLQNKSSATTQFPACVCVFVGGRFSSGDRRHIPVCRSVKHLFCSFCCLSSFVWCFFGVHHPDYWPSARILTFLTFQEKLPIQYNH